MQSRPCRDVARWKPSRCQRIIDPDRIVQTSKRKKVAVDGGDCHCCEDRYQSVDQMDQQNAALASSLVSSTYIQQGADALCTRRRLIKTLLSQRCMPKDGWDEDTVEMFIKVRQASQYVSQTFCCFSLIISNVHIFPRLCSGGLLKNRST